MPLCELLSQHERHRASIAGVRSAAYDLTLQIFAVHVLAALRQADEDGWVEVQRTVTFVETHVLSHAIVRRDFFGQVSPCASQSARLAMRRQPRTLLLLQVLGLLQLSPLPPAEDDSSSGLWANVRRFVLLVEDSLYEGRLSHDAPLDDSARALCTRLLSFVAHLLAHGAVVPLTAVISRERGSTKRNSLVSAVRGFSSKSIEQPSAPHEKAQPVKRNSMLQAMRALGGSAINLKEVREETLCDVALRTLLVVLRTADAAEAHASSTGPSSPRLRHTNVAASASPPNSPSSHVGRGESCVTFAVDAPSQLASVVSFIAAHCCQPSSRPPKLAKSRSIDELKEDTGSGAQPGQDVEQLSRLAYRAAARLVRALQVHDAVALALQVRVFSRRPPLYARHCLLAKIAFGVRFSAGRSREFPLMCTQILLRSLLADDSVPTWAWLEDSLSPQQFVNERRAWIVVLTAQEGFEAAQRLEQVLPPAELAFEERVTSLTNTIFRSVHMRALLPPAYYSLRARSESPQLAQCSTPHNCRSTTLASQPSSGG